MSSLAIVSLEHVPWLTAWFMVCSINSAITMGFSKFSTRTNEYFIAEELDEPPQSDEAINPTSKEAIVDDSNLFDISKQFTFTESNKSRLFSHVPRKTSKEMTIEVGTLEVDTPVVSVVKPSIKLSSTLRSEHKLPSPKSVTFHMKIVESS